MGGILRDITFITGELIQKIWLRSVHGNVCLNCRLKYDWEGVRHWEVDVSGYALVEGR